VGWSRRAHGTYTRKGGTGTCGDCEGPAWVITVESVLSGEFGDPSRYRGGVVGIL